MDHNFVLNSLSFPAANAQIAFDLLLDSMKGLIAVGTPDDRRALYSDQQPGIGHCVIAPDTTWHDFLAQLNQIDEQDLQLALLEIEDKTPMFDFVSDDQIEKIASVAFYFPDEAYTGSIDILAMAWELDAILLSIATAEKWCASEIAFAQFTTAKHPTEHSWFRNLSCRAHGLALNRQLLDLLNKSLVETFKTCHFSEHFLDWVNQLAADLQARIRVKLALAESKQFQGGKPLFDTLTGDDAAGLREIRFSAVQGGAVRILFDFLPSGKPAILVGWIKKSNSDGYTSAIIAAKPLLKAMKKLENA